MAERRYAHNILWATLTAISKSDVAASFSGHRVAAQIVDVVPAPGVSDDFHDIVFAEIEEPVLALIDWADGALPVVQVRPAAAGPPVYGNAYLLGEPDHSRVESALIWKVETRLVHGGHLPLRVATMREVVPN